MEKKKTRSDAPRTAPATQEQPAKRRPLKTIRVEDVNATIWPREVLVKGVPTIFYSVTFERSYRDNTGQWRYTRYFDVSDLGKVIGVAQQAAEYIDSLQKQNGQQEAA